MLPGPGACAGTTWDTVKEGRDGCRAVCEKRCDGHRAHHPDRRGWAALDDYRLHASHHTPVFILAANRHTEEVVR
jgi:hypothetical protein